MLGVALVKPMDGVSSCYTMHNCFLLQKLVFASTLGTLKHSCLRSWSLWGCINVGTRSCQSSFTRAPGKIFSKLLWQFIANNMNQWLDWRRSSQTCLQFLPPQGQFPKCCQIVFCLCSMHAIKWRIKFGMPHMQLSSGIKLVANRAVAFILVICIATIAKDLVFLCCWFLIRWHSDIPTTRITDFGELLATVVTFFGDALSHASASFSCGGPS